MTHLLKCQLLQPHHHLEDFTSGEATLDQWLKNSALTNQKRGLSRTFVLLASDSSTNQVVGYYTLAAHVIERDHLSKRLGHGLPHQTPAILLGKLALDLSLQGQGYGGDLLAHAMAACERIARQLGSRFLVVDALNTTAARFYQHYGFTAVPDQTSMRLIHRLGYLEH
jgi:GNAT superfamily N-acetyltransferase